MYFLEIRRKSTYRFHPVKEGAAIAVKSGEAKDADDQLMTIKQMATYLNLNERTVLKLVTDGALPGVKIGNQWRFRKAMIDTWLDDQMLGVTPRLVGEHDGERGKDTSTREMLALASCFQPDHIISELQAKKKTAVVEELAGLATATVKFPNAGDTVDFYLDHAMREDVATHVLRVKFRTRTIWMLSLFTAWTLLFFSISTNQEYYTFPAYLALFLLLASALAGEEEEGRQPWLLATSAVSVTVRLVFAAVTASSMPDRTMHLPLDPL